ncbi:Sec-independent protein translocase protein TATC chloroplastic [Bienertia sinuspersici]
MANTSKQENELQSLQQEGDESKGSYLYPRPVAPTAAQKMLRPFGVKASKKRKKREEFNDKEEEEVEMVKEDLPAAATDATIEDDLPGIPIAILDQNNWSGVVFVLEKPLVAKVGKLTHIFLTADELENVDQDGKQGALYDFLYPSKDELLDDKAMTIFDHLEELRQRLFVSVLAVCAAILGYFAFSKDLIMILEKPGYCGLLLGSPAIVYETIAFVEPGLTRAEKRFLGPIVLGSSVLFYAGITFSYFVLTPAALTFFVNYAEGNVSCTTIVVSRTLVLLFLDAFECD